MIMYVVYCCCDWPESIWDSEEAADKRKAELNETWHGMEFVEMFQLNIPDGKLLLDAVNSHP